MTRPQAHLPQVLSHWEYGTLKDSYRWQTDKGYGIGFWREVMCHRRVDSASGMPYFVATWNGTPIAEVRSDEIVLKLPDDGHLTPGVKTRWADFFNFVSSFEHTRSKRLGLPVEYKINFVTRSGSVDVAFSKAVRLKYDPQTYHVLSAEAADPPPPTVKKDNAKYRAFNARLKQLKSVLIAQIKLGAYDKYEQEHFVSWYHCKLREEAVKRFAKHNNNWMSHPEMQEIIDAKVSDVIATLEQNQSPPVDEFENIVLIGAALHMSDENKDFREHLKRRVLNAMGGVQRRYLQVNCLTIAESNNSLTPSDETHDQDRQLLPPSGLREVQVPSEAEVC